MRFEILAILLVMHAGAAPGAQAFDPPARDAERTVRVPRSDVVIQTWSEQRGGDVASMYAVSVDGETFVEPREFDGRIKLRAGMFDPQLATPIVPVALQTRVQRDAASTSLFIVQFIAPPTDAQTRPLRDLGAQPRVFLAEHSFIVETSAATANHIATLPHVRWVGPYHPAYRVEEVLLDELVGDIAKIPTRRYSIMLLERGLAAQQIVTDRIVQLGGIVNARIPQGFRIEATLTGTQLLEVAHLNQVQFIDRWGPAGNDMNLARQIGGATPLLSGLGFTGQGVRGQVMDDGIRLTHQAFANPSVLVHGVVPSDLPHGTNTYGIVFGNGAANASGTGLLPDREQGVFATYFQLVSFGGLMTRYTQTEEAVDPNGPYRVVFQSNSWGGPLTTLYTTSTAEMDDIVFLNDLLSCQSQSNQGTTNSRPEAWAKNVISVGGIRHVSTLSRTDDFWNGASHGPAADGRVKPDLAHFYDSVLCPTNTNDTAYRTDFFGTSAATPIVCGYAGLLMQMWHEEVFDGFGGAATVFESRPAMATAKALLINSAFRYNWNVGGSNASLTRFKQGWGMPDLERLYVDRVKTFIINETDPIEPFGSQTYQIQVGPGETQLRATMVYTDPAGNPASPVARVNDLSMKVTAPNGTFYWGNSGLTLSNDSFPNGNPNAIDTVENVFVNNPIAGVWTVEIFGHEIVQDARLQTPQLDADFALVVVGGIVVTPCVGDIVVDGTVGVPDLLAVINAWGPCVGCAADLNGDDSVGVPDLLMIINAWGPCP